MSTVTVCQLDDLIDGEARRFDVDGARLCVVRIGDDVLCVADRCSHEDFSLSEGEVFADERETKAVAVYSAGVTDGRVEVELR